MISKTNTFNWKKIKLQTKISFIIKKFIFFLYMTINHSNFNYYVCFRPVVKANFVPINKITYTFHIYYLHIPFLLLILIKLFNILSYQISHKNNANDTLTI